MSDYLRNRIRRDYWLGVPVNRIARTIHRPISFVESALFTRIPVAA